MTSSHSFSVKAMASLRAMMPALFSRMSMRPKAASAAATIRATGSVLERSACTCR